ncbi:hypothetical protein IMCC20628_00643 [Hoeflea sp. IMCC20628]|uniref:hypothetical protein n=1 Tax=Hoeflea sp. IMCC20628 TaxID=1620421 RepID=UPI00063BD5C2|nr:hypothetical protein [Hoeflea sp. IMCC20628]AKH99367.1 hypothetical protein IMCC20628_00643 [Hoeflea sp. IMCC20628]
MTDRSKPHSNDRRLADIVREVKIAAADRTDVVVDIRDADRARLELLAQEVQPLLDDIDPADDRFDFGISPGLQPRLWIDSVAHVHMGHDRRVFRFVRDTRLGRVILSDTSDMTATADSVGRYIAERVIERERILAGDFEAMKASASASHGTSASAGDHDQQPTAKADAADDKAAARSATAPDKWTSPREDTATDTSRPMAASLASVPEIAKEPASKPGRGAGFVLGASWFILGCVAGSAALVMAFWDRISALIN